MHGADEQPYASLAPLLAAGVQCTLAIQEAFAAFNRTRAGTDAQVSVKIGMHMGPCISVTLNGILDYYGKVGFVRVPATKPR